jgi:formate hydrogenlyase subunit 4
LIICVFGPWGLAIADAGVVDRLIGTGVYVVKLGVAGLMLAAFETSIAKMRVFRVPNFLGAALMLGFLGALLLFVSRTLK